jgi:tryptophanyl-tRNA synthetase
VLADFAGRGLAQFNPALGQLAVARLSPINAEMRRLMADPGEIDRILGEGAECAAAIAEPILAETYHRVGFLQPRAGRRPGDMPPARALGLS